DMLVLPSWSEGMPNVLLEALAIGLPCVVSDIPAHRNIIGTTSAALIFDPADPQQLAMRINLVRTKPALARKLADEGKKLTHQCTPDKMARAYHEVYSHIVHAPRPTAK